MRLFRRRDAGFTIIEVLVALTLLAAVILLVTRAFLTVLSVTSQGGRVTRPHCAVSSSQSGRS